MQIEVDVPAELEAPIQAKLDEGISFRLSYVQPPDYAVRLPGPFYTVEGVYGA